MSLKVMSFNANGLRAAERKGFFQWFLGQNIDVLCVQETKAKHPALESEKYEIKGYQRFLFDAEKPGYSGVALYTRRQPNKVTTGLGFSPADTEGRYIQADFGGLSVASIYLPSGSSGLHRQEQKWIFLECYESILRQQAQDGREYIICGDLNIVHNKIDIKNWRSNQKSSGCMPEERAWLDVIFSQIGFVDAFRVVNQEPGQYTWWSQRGRARENNVGWRIDYQVVSAALKDKVEKAEIYREQKFSDHAPLTITYGVKF